MELTTIAVTRDSPARYGSQVATVTLQRADVRNAFNARSIAELTWVFATLSAEPDLRAIVLAAEGSAFCAGADLHWMRAMADFSSADNLADAATLAQMLATMDRCPHPVIARIQGDVVAGGMGLVAVCDIAVAVDSARFCLSEVLLGLIPATISPYVIRAMGQQAARRYFLTAERFSAATAHHLGFIHEVVPADTLDAALATLLAALMAASPHAVRQAKLLVRDIAGAVIDDVLIADTAARIATIRAGDEAREGVRAFLDKHKPSWAP